MKSKSPGKKKTLNLKVKNTPEAPINIQPANQKKYFIVSSIIIVLLTLLAYSNLSKNEFLNWDDDYYVTENVDITDLQSENLAAFFTQKYVYNYLPLTMISYALDYKIGKFNPRVYTATNLFIHTLNALLVFWLILVLLRKNDTSKNRLSNSVRPHILIAFVTAVLFAIHPMQVESVAWVSERKNILYTFFFLLSLISYLDYLNRRNYGLLLLSLVLFAASLLSKATAVSLALCLVIIDYYNGRKIFSSKVILEKIPFFLLALVFGIIAWKSQQIENELVGGVNFPFYKQLAFAAYGFVNYIIKLIISLNLSAFYSYPQSASFVHYSCLFLVLALVLILVYYRKKISPLVTLCILFFTANLVFLVQIVPVGDALMADRYIYVSSIGFFLLLALGLEKLSRQHKLIYGMGIATILFYSYTTHQQIKTWNNSLVFWDHVISKDNHIPMAWNNRGLVKLGKGNFEGALSDFNQAISIMPESRKAHNNRAISLDKLGRTDEALASYTKAITIDSNYADALCNRAFLYYKADKLKEALHDFDRTLRLNPNYLRAYIGRAKTKSKQGDFPGAIADCDKALSLTGSLAEIFSIKGFAFYKQSDFLQAIGSYSKAIELSPRSMNNYHNRGASYFYSGNYQAAIQDMNMVLQYLPEQAVSYYIRGMAYTLSGNNKQGCSDLQTAINKGFLGAQTDLINYCK